MSIKTKFDKFHADNPHVYRLFAMYAYQLIRAGHKKLSSKMIIERIRWETHITTTSSGWHMTRGKKLLINNSYTAYFSRRFMTDFPKLAHMFEVRECKP